MTKIWQTAIFEWTERTDDRCTRGHKSQILHFLKGVQYYRKSVRLLSTIIAYFRQHQSSLASFVGCYQRTLNVGGKYDCVAGIHFALSCSAKYESTKDLLVWLNLNWSNWRLRAVAIK